MEPEIQHPETLEDMLNNFLMIKELWKEERQNLALQNVELKKHVISLLAQVEKLKEVDVELRKQISASIKSASSEMAEKTASEFKKSVTEDVKLATYQLKKASEENTRQLQQAQIVSENNWIYFFLGLFVLPIIASLLIFWWLSPKPMMALTDQQMSTYQDGQTLEVFWPKLNKKQQNWLLELSDGKINNHGKRIDKIQDNSNQGEDQQSGDGDNENG